MECSRREEILLDTLPCLYNCIPDSWSDLDSLVTAVKTAVKDEQKKIVWIEQSPLQGIYLRIVTEEIGKKIIIYRCIFPLTLNTGY